MSDRRRTGSTRDGNHETGDGPPTVGTSPDGRPNDGEPGVDVPSDGGVGEVGPNEKAMARRPEGPAHERKATLGQTLKRTFTELREDNATDWAASLTYYAMLSLFPAVLAMVSIVGLFGDPQEVTRKLTEIVESFGPSGTADTLREPIQSLTADRGTAGIMLVVGIVVALWSGSGYVGAFMRASNVIWEVEEGRPIYKLRPLQMLVTLIQVLLLAAVGLALVATGPVARNIGSNLGIGDTALTVWDIAKWPVMVLVVLLCIGLLYYAAPNAKVRGFRSVLPGAVAAVVVWAVASALFALYVANFGSYDKTYGSLGGIIIFLVWLWLTNLAVVFGAELNAERERSREIAEGRPDAERELQLDLRDEPKPTKRSRTG
jgi:membrane protein